MLYFFTEINKRAKEFFTVVILISLLVIGWVAAAVIGTQAYFRGEQSKPIHERNWHSESFELVAISVTGTETDYNRRVPGYGRLDAYSSNLLPRN